MRGLDRAGVAAGLHGLQGRSNAVGRPGSHDRATTGSVTVNRGGTVRGLDRADDVAGTHGQRGRMNARTKQMRN